MAPAFPGGAPFASAARVSSWRLRAGSARRRPDDQTSLEANKAIARQVFEVAINNRNRAALKELYARDVVDYGTWARQMSGPAGMPITAGEFQAMFPDVTVFVETTIAEVDLVATRVT